MKRLSIVGIIACLAGVAYGATDKIPFLPTYTAVGSALVPAAVPTDICKIAGSSTKTVRVTNVSLSSLQTTAGINNFFLVKRSADNVGGIGTALTAVPHSSASAAATTSTISYSANPITLGTLVGVIKAVYALSPSAANVADSNFYEWNYQQDGAGQPIYLRSAAEVLSVNFGGAAKPAGLVIDCAFTWNEE